MNATKIGSVFLILLGVAMTMTQAAADTAQDEKEIRDVITDFMKSGDQRNSDLAEQTLHESFQLIYHGKDGVLKSNKAEYKGLLEKGVIGGESRTVVFETVAVTNAIASVHAVFESDAALFDQYVNLIRENGAWKIVNIVLEYMPKGE